MRYRVTGIGAELQIRVPPAILKFRPFFDIAARNAAPGFGLVFETVVPL